MPLGNLYWLDTYRFIPSIMIWRGKMFRQQAVRVNFDGRLTVKRQTSNVVSVTFR